MSEIKPFLCDTIEKSMLRVEWEKWLRSLELYLDSEDISSKLKKRSKLLHLGGPQLQEVVFNIPEAIVEYKEKEDNDVYGIVVTKLNEYFSPTRNSTFERHLFHELKPMEGEDFNKFLLKVRHQAQKCSFGKTEIEAKEINIKDKLIDGWATLELKKRLLEKEMTLDEVIEACKVNEQISNQTSSSSFVESGFSNVNRIVNKSRDNAECSRCGFNNHSANDPKCPAKNEKCNKCSMIGHFARKCKTRSKRQWSGDRNEKPSKRQKVTANRVHYVEDESQDEKLHCFRVEDMDEDSTEKIDCNVGGLKLNLIIDSGSRFNLISEKDYGVLKQEGAVLFNERDRSEAKFKAYAAKTELMIKKIFEAPIKVSGREEIISSFYVIEGGTHSLLGKESALKLKVLKLGLSVNKIDEVDKFPAIKGIRVKLSINKSVRPIIQPVRRVPVALEAKVDAKLQGLLDLDIIERVTQPSAWISALVIVLKENGDIRLCVDMRQANKAIQRENYPFPTFENITSKLTAASYFSRLDLKDAYHQLELDEQSQEITTFITHKGLFRYKRLFFGVNSAPEIFQREFERMLITCKGCFNYLDDVIVTGRSEKEHDDNLKQVLKVFAENNVLVNEKKCVYKMLEIRFLGHIISRDGFSPDPEKVKTVLEFRAPKSKEELRSFLGLVTYLGKFIPDLADITEPLRKLIKQDVKFLWEDDQENSFQQLKISLANIPKLSYFDQNHRTRLIADASPVALGAVLLQFTETDQVNVISFASRSLSETEQRYSQTEKESLALVWSVERFYYYLAGLRFELVTDHKPLMAIFKPTSKPPARIERWVLRLQSFDFNVIYQAGKYNIADSLSRLCKIENKKLSFDKSCELNVYAIVESSVPVAVSISEVAKSSTSDEEIMEAVNSTRDCSWTNTKSSYYPFRYELSSLGNMLLRGNKLVIPKMLRSRILELAHEGHPGESAMKRRLRSKVWWPLIDREAEKYVKSCRDCLLVSQPNPPTPMIRHKFPDQPWTCLAMDLLGPLPNRDFILAVIDYYSRYMELKFLKSIKSADVIGFLDEIFSHHGYPKSIKADNGRQFVSEEFRSFCDKNGIHLITSPPHWPQANGEVENLNRSLVKRLQIAHANGDDYRSEINRFMLMYNVTPHSTTGVAPSELLFKRLLRDKIPSVQDFQHEPLDSEARDNDTSNKQKGKESEDSRRRAKDSDIGIGDKVLIRNVVFPNTAFLKQL